MSAPDPPPVPADELEAGGWEKQDERTETLFEMPAMRVLGTTRQYDDARSRAAVREATAGRVTGSIRFFAVTRLGFEPPLPPGIGSTMIAPTLRSEVRRNFGARLEERGLTDVERGRSERVRLPDRSRARLTKYTARDRLDGVILPLECWVGVWTGGRDVFVVSGGHPRAQLAAQLDQDTDEAVLTRPPGEYREEFISLVRGVAATDD